LDLLSGAGGAQDKVALTTLIDAARIAGSALRLVTPCFAPVLDRQELMGCAGLHLWSCWTQRGPKKRHWNAYLHERSLETSRRHRHRHLPPPPSCASASAASAACAAAAATAAATTTAAVVAASASAPTSCASFGKTGSCASFGEEDNAAGG
jgi:hypothetical protein